MGNNAPTTGVVQELAIPQSSQTRFARVVRGLLDQDECAELVARVNDKGFTPALLNIGGGRQCLARASRDGHRVIVDNPQMARRLFEMVEPYLPKELKGGSFDGWHLVGLNERLRILCYTPGQEFPEHQDGCYMRPNGDRSIVTIQLYLNDLPTEYGGATNFYPGRPHMVGHQPEAGSALIFTQDLPHEGSLV